ncbi:hypothetical protein F5884DRAFT_750254 [Xylogone sp. PMI_703]|nr:hypothetical protein F5884DRAFT_750254 [Xylogone sp. PMI_703]
MKRHTVVDDEAGISSVERGRKRYLLKDYQGALEAFTEAVTSSTGFLLNNALDLRAATYEKLGELKPALKDAKQMIELCPDLSNGYLRCAKVLQLRGEKELALRIYERGLKKVKAGTDKNRAMLQSMYHKLLQSEKPKKNFDPLVMLPVELSEMVAWNLDLRSRIICLSVSKPWKIFLESRPNLWVSFDATISNRPISERALKAFLRRSKYKVDRVKISMSKGYIGEKGLAYITQTCQQLSHLEIRPNGIIGRSLLTALPSAKNLSTLSIRCPISPTAMLQALELCHQTLVDVEMSIVGATIDDSTPRMLQNWPRLEKLRRLFMVGKDKQIEVASLIDSIPNIESLTLRGVELINSSGTVDFTSLTNLTQLDLEESIRFMPKIPPTVSRLNLAGNYKLGAFHRVDGVSDLELPLLEVFDCRQTSLGDSNIATIIAPSVQSGKLKSLSMGEQPQDSNEREEPSKLPRSETLEILSLCFAPYRTEDQIIAIVSLYPNLQKLDVAGCPVTGYAVKRFVEMGIKWLDLRWCKDVRRENVEFARSEGVDVHYSMDYSVIHRNSRYPSLLRDSCFRLST